jgi:hypothetical protein
MTLQAVNSEYEIARLQLKMAKLAVQQEEFGSAKPAYPADKPVFEKLGAQADLAVAVELERHIPS